MKTNATAPDDKGFRFPPVIISHAVWLSFRFSLRFRESEELLAQRGSVVTSETVRQWCFTCGQTDANEWRRRRPRCGDKGHRDEGSLNINGKTHSLWRAVDPNGNVLDMRVAEPTEQTRSETLFSQAPQRTPLCPTRHHHRYTEEVWSGETRDPAWRRTSAAPACSTIEWNIPTNPHAYARRTCGASHQPAHIQRFLSAFGPITRHFQPRRHRLCARDYRAILPTSFLEWNEVTAVKRVA